MRAALGEARGALYVPSPNPRVGCVLVSESGEELGRGATQRAGGAHAEVMALRSAAARGASVVAATAYVTLEPCSHTGLTGPCCELLVQAGIARVVASLADPNPEVSGRGFECLRTAGVDVVVGPGADESRELNLGFFSRMVRHVPWVRLKVAASVDGFTALPDGTSQWMTGRDARRDGHHWRARSCSVLTGIGTVLADNPRLDVREVDTPRQPKLAVVDSHLRTPVDAALFQPQRQVLIYYVDAASKQVEALKRTGATLVAMPGGDGKVNLPGVLRDLAARGTNEVHVEAGAQLNGALLGQGLVDEWLIYLAPMMLGKGRGMAEMTAVAELSHALRFRFGLPVSVGDDLRLMARGLNRDEF